MKVGAAVLASDLLMESGLLIESGLLMLPLDGADVAGLLIVLGGVAVGGVDVCAMAGSTIIAVVAIAIAIRFIVSSPMFHNGIAIGIVNHSVTPHEKRYKNFSARDGSRTTTVICLPNARTAQIVPGAPPFYRSSLVQIVAVQ
jgi:hypothetical protein